MIALATSPEAGGLWAALVELASLAALVVAVLAAAALVPLLLTFLGRPRHQPDVPPRSGVDADRAPAEGHRVRS